MLSHFLLALASYFVTTILTILKKLLTFANSLIYTENAFRCRHLKFISSLEPIYLYTALCMDRLAFFVAQKGVIAISKTIYIRNVDAGVLAKIDELATQKGISRNKLVNIILETFVTTDKIKEIEDNYSGLIETTTNAISNVTLALQQLQQLVIQSNIERRNNT